MTLSSNNCYTWTTRWLNFELYAFVLKRGCDSARNPCMIRLRMDLRISLYWQALKGFRKKKIIITEQWGVTKLFLCCCLKAFKMSWTLPLLCPYAESPAWNISWPSWNDVSFELLNFPEVLRNQVFFVVLMTGWITLFHCVATQTQSLI